MLLKIECRGFIVLPPGRHQTNNGKRTARALVLHETTRVDGRLSDVTPVNIRILQDRHERELFATYMNLYHYLGLNTLDWREYSVLDKKPG